MHLKTMVAIGVVGAIVLAIIVAVCATSIGGGSSEPLTNIPKYAVVSINVGTEKSRISGLIELSQMTEDGPVIIKGTVNNLPPNTEHGFHVHELGDFRDLNSPCGSTLGHFNPNNKTHGAPADKVRHVGDLGNILADANGVAKINIEDSMISLNGPNSVIGRAIVVHEKADDLGKGGKPDSLKTGDAGSRIGCGIIGISNKAL